MSSTPDPDLLGWARGPLPSADLEHIAWELFRFRYPQVDYASSLFSDERNDCRRLALKMRVKFLKMDRWTLGTAVEKLTDESCHLVFGDRAVGTGTRGEVRDYAESYLEDLAKLFGGDMLAKGRSESWKHVPEDEVDDSEIEVVKPAVIQ